MRQAESLEEAILRESREYLPFPLEDAILDYPSIVPLSQEKPHRYKAIIVAIRRDHIDQYLQMLKKAGLVVEAVDFGVCSLIRLHEYLYGVSDNPIILCNVGFTQSMLSVVTKESILAQRNVPWGGQTLLNKVVSNLELFNEKDKAKILLQKYGLLYEAREQGFNGTDLPEEGKMDSMQRTIYQIVSPYIEELIYELHKIIGYVMPEVQNAAFEGIYMYGLASFIHHMDGYLASRLNIPTKLINPMTKMSLSHENLLPDVSEGAPFALAIGLAMRKVSWH